MTESNQTGCKRCGHCCHWVIFKDNQPILKRCKHLIRMMSDRTICRIYKKAMKERHQKSEHVVDTFIKDGVKYKVKCNLRAENQFEYEGCPFNKGEKKTFEEYLTELGLKIPWK